jgi:Fe2+ transport system protein FeoA
VSTTRLADLPTGVDVVIVDVDGLVAGLDATLLRLCEMGLVPQTPVRVTRRAPLGDPIEVGVRGTRLVLRAAEARRFIVAPAAAASGAADDGGRR